MSLDLQNMVWDDEEIRGQSKVVLLRLATYVKKEAWDRGRDFFAWPSQNTLASKCGIPRSSVERALANLVELGKIRDTGRRKQRRTVVWELYPSAAPEVRYGWEVAADLPDSRAGDLPDHGAGDHDLPDSEASQLGAVVDLPDSPVDLPDPESDLPDHGAGTCPTTGHKREEKGENNGKGNEREGARGARDIYSPPDSTEELAEVESLLAGRPADKLLIRRRDELRDSLGAAA